MATVHAFELANARASLSSFPLPPFLQYCSYSIDRRRMYSTVVPGAAGDRAGRRCAFASVNIEVSRVAKLIPSGWCRKQYKLFETFPQAKNKLMGENKKDGMAMLNGVSLGLLPARRVEWLLSLLTVRSTTLSKNSLMPPLPVMPQYHCRVSCASRVMHKLID